MTVDKRDLDSVMLRRATFASFAVALCLIVTKSMAYFATGSVALLGSLIDSLMDAGASLVNLVAVRYALKPPDRDHRFGHGKAESLAAVVQSVFIVCSCVFLIHEAFHRLVEAGEMRRHMAGIGVMLFSLVATAALVSYQRFVARRTGSAAIEADALHYQGDLLGNVAVIVALFLSQWGLRMADPLLAVAIAAYLLYSARAILARALDELLDHELPEDQRNRILRLARAHPDVYGVHDLRTRRSGRTVVLQLHIELDPDLPLLEAHRIAQDVKSAIRAELPGADVMIHEDPRGLIEDRIDARVESSVAR